jgi:CRISPR type I-E-associated protein CasB/Cse2
MESNINQEKTIGSICEAWWNELKQGRAGARARLRRGGSILDLLLEPQTHKLRYSLQSINAKVSADRIAVVAGILSDIDSSSVLSFAHTLGSMSADISAIEPRMQKLLRIEWNDNEELLTQMRRILPLINRAVNVGSLSEVLCRWNDTAKKQIAVEFYEAKSRKVGASK